MRNLDKASVSHDETLVRELRDDPELAAAYIQAAMEDEEEPAVLLLALRHVADAYGMPMIAERAGIQRESLYRSLSPKDNPTLRTLTTVLKAVGLRLTVITDRHSVLHSTGDPVEAAISLP